jgi:ADP-heptose:LPS heptosyltransferase
VSDGQWHVRGAGDGGGTTPPPARVCAFAQLHMPGLGDLLQRNIMLGLIRRAHPGARVTLVAGESLSTANAALFADHLMADEVMRCPDPGDDDEARWRAFGVELARRRFDLCVVDPGCHTLGPAHARRAGIPVRIGYPKGVAADRDITRAVRLPPPLFGFPDLYEYAQALAQALGLAGPLRAAEVVPPLPRRDEELPQLDVPGPRIAVHPGGATLWNRRWPLDRFAELCTRLAVESGAHLFLIGTGAERTELERLRDACPPGQATLLLDASLNTTANLLAGMDLLVGNDSGPGHLAAAVGTPTTIIYGPGGTEPMFARVYPKHRGVSLRYPCQKITHELDKVDSRRCEYDCVVPYRGADGPYPRCMTDLPVDDVHSAVVAQLRAHRPQVGGTHVR